MNKPKSFRNILTEGLRNVKFNSKFISNVLGAGKRKGQKINKNGGKEI
jgi:hypothetical protein